MLQMEASAERLRRMLPDIESAEGRRAVAETIATIGHATVEIAKAISEVPISLQQSDEMGTIGTMDKTTGAAVSAAKTKHPTLFQQRLHERGLSLPGWAATKKKFELEIERAKSWVKKPGKGGRPVPRVWADMIAGEFDDPGLADPKNWPNGIRG